MKNNGLLNSDNRKKILNLIYSVGATAVFNMVIQFLVYPDFERRLGSEQYGVVLSMISLVSIIAGSCGYAVNCSRLLGVTTGRNNNGDYNLILLAMGFIGSLIGVAYLFYLDIASPLTVGLYIALMFTTMLRYYSEVDFKLSTNFFRYMIYYLLVSVGYIIGLFVFHLTEQWMLALILGEALAFVYVCIRGTLYRRPMIKKSDDLRPIFASIVFVLISSLIDNLTLNADRILLLSLTGDGTAVTTYYIASLVGKVIALLTVPINALLISYLVRYSGALTRKLWSIVIGAAIVFGGAAFGGCMLVSPWLIGILYPDNLAAVSVFFVPAILGQIFYFVSGVLMATLLRFKGEKKQFIFNTGYAVEFFACVILGTVLGGLNGFIWAIVLANALRFVGALIWGFIPTKNIAPSEEQA